MSTIYHGQNVIVLPPQQTFSVRSGYHFRQVHLCQSGSVDTVLNSLIASGYDPVEVNPSPGMWEVVANTSVDPANPNAIFPSWQIQKYSVTADLLDARSNPTAKQLHPKHLQVLQHARRNPNSQGVPPVFDGTLHTATSTAQQQLRLCYELWTAMQLGIKGRPKEFPILRRSYIINDAYTITDTLDAVDDTIISTGTLISSENVPTAYASIIPPSGITDVSIPYLTFKYGWVKNYPDVVTQGENRSQVSQEWIYGLWSTLEYFNEI